MRLYIVLLLGAALYYNLAGATIVSIPDDGRYTSSFLYSFVTKHVFQQLIDLSKLNNLYWDFYIIKQGASQLKVTNEILHEGHKCVTPH